MSRVEEIAAEIERIDKMIGDLQQDIADCREELSLIKYDDAIDSAEIAADIRVLQRNIAFYRDDRQRLLDEMEALRRSWKRRCHREPQRLAARQRGRGGIRHLLGHRHGVYDEYALLGADMDERKWRAGDPLPDDHPWRKYSPFPQRLQHSQMQRHAKLHDLKPVLRTRFELRLDAEMQQQLTDLVYHERINASEVIRRAVETRHRNLQPERVDLTQWDEPIPLREPGAS
jgi:hypothetical protein